jgi:hypothetical protein
MCARVHPSCTAWVWMAGSPGEVGAGGFLCWEEY